MEGYSTKIVETSKDLTAKERVKIKEMADFMSLDEATAGNNSITINPDYYAIVSVHNEKSKGDKDYSKYVVVDKNGDGYMTGSNSFWESFINIFEEMEDANETDFEIKVFTRPSKNYSGKSFITCSIV